MERSVSIIILAAGLGTRMKSDRAKVLHLIHDSPMIRYVVDTAVQVAGVERVVVVVGHQAEAVKAAVSAFYPVSFALQAEQRGTGHAVRCAMGALAPQTAQVVILCGDVPLLRATTVERLIDRHCRDANDLTLLAVEMAQPEGYGRILTDAHGRLQGIVEEADASLIQRSIKLVNSGIYCVAREFLDYALGRIHPDNVQKEYYLTDIVAIAGATHRRLGVMTADAALEVSGVNTVEQLAAVTAAMPPMGKTA